MKIIYNGNSENIADELKDFVQNKLSFLNKYIDVDDNMTVKINVKEYKGASKIELTVLTRVGLLRSEIVHEDLHTGLELNAASLEEKLKNNKYRLSRRHKDSLKASFIEESSTVEDKAYKTKTVYAEEMEIDEAIMKMEMLSHNFFVYKDKKDKTVSLVYKRNDGQYGLLEIKE